MKIIIKVILIAVFCHSLVKGTASANVSSNSNQTIASSSAATQKISNSQKDLSNSCNAGDVSCGQKIEIRNLTANPGQNASELQDILKQIAEIQKEITKKNQMVETLGELRDYYTQNNMKLPVSVFNKQI